MSIKETDNVILSCISEVWFIKTSIKLLEGSFKYYNRRRLLKDKSGCGKKSLSIADPRTKIIEKALLNALEPQFEGYFLWESINKKEYLSEIFKDNCKMTITDKEVFYFKKKVLCPNVFYAYNYGSRPNKSAHQALQNIKY
jgi:retron-type reverse transcriptase